MSNWKILVTIRADEAIKRVPWLYLFLIRRGLRKFGKVGFCICPDANNDTVHEGHFWVASIEGYKSAPVWCGGR